MMRQDRSGHPGSVLIEGQFCGHASLAIVNRCLAKALIARGVDVRILPTDRHEGLDELVRANLLKRAVAHAGAVDVHLRNAWPPETDNMCGRRNGLVCWAWEESEIPAVMASRFNLDLDFILTTADYVGEALKRSGVTIPCPTVGNGADQVLAFSDVKATRGKRKRLFHISTFLPRKAPEALVKAFVQAFDGRTDVELYIKTSHNPHNSAQAIIDRWSEASKSPPPIVLDERSLEASEIVSLYKGASAVVLVSRGEGFGLPLAEAMMLNVPVIAARHGGQADFCTEDTAFLVESRPARSQSHVAAAYGLWEEPDIDSLAQAMRRAIDDKPAATRKATAARRLARERLTWSAVAGRVVKALSATSPARAVAPRYEVVSTWNEECGLATYSEQFYGTEALKNGLARVWARRPLADVLDLPADPDNVSRLWGYDGVSLQRFADQVGNGAVGPVLWFQHHPGYFSGDDMRRVLPALRRGRERLLITLHNVRETLQGGAEWLKDFDVVVAHSADDVEDLGRAGIRGEVLPHGVRMLAEPREPQSEIFNVGTFGFLTEHKNIELLVYAVHLARRSDPRIRLILANAARRERQSRVARTRVELLIRHLGMEGAVDSDFSFLPDDEVVRRLAACDLLVFPYGASLEGASGAARMAIAMDRPTLLSDSRVFRDLVPFSHLVRALDPETLAEAILGLANDPAVLKLHDRARRRYAQDHNWNVIAQRAIALMNPQ